ncbi:archease [Candidatus Woesearchaeota archaeon]|nr:archease [Candidatus Woesearchaeota archaeon]
MKKYEFFDHTADVLFQAYGKTLVELCTNAALALQDVQVKLSTVGAKRKKTIEITAQTPEKLLFDFLQELVFVKDVNQLLFSKFNMDI